MTKTENTGQYVVLFAIEYIQYNLIKFNIVLETYKAAQTETKNQ